VLLHTAPLHIKSKPKANKAHTLAQINKYQWQPQTKWKQSEILSRNEQTIGEFVCVSAGKRVQVGSAAVK